MDKYISHDYDKTKSDTIIYIYDIVKSSTYGSGHEGAPVLLPGFAISG